MLVLLIIICILVEYTIEFFLFSKYNQTPLFIETFDKSNEPYHPSVLYFKNGWNGFKYWMVETPYPIGASTYRDRWECPSIHVSNDGVSWSVPLGLSNPIDDLTEKQIINKDFFSDPHLVYVDNHIECFYRYSRRLIDGFHNYLVRKTSSNGINWHNKEILIDMMDKNFSHTLGDIVRSPSIVYDERHYKMWYVDNINPNGRKHICFTTSIDGKNWQPHKKCILLGKNINPWHIDVAYIDGLYFLTIYDFYSLTIWAGKVETEFSFIDVCFTPSLLKGSFYSDGLYRSSLIKDEKSFKLYFSAYSDKKTSLGLIEGKTINSLKIKSVSGCNVPFYNFTKTYISIWKIRLWNIKNKWIKNK